ncbi:hypothetical protein Glove_374g28 [Diversispora epigaea]|uniref:Uncharacterized protein n=1 Tax=Diversispora epigaea TaxID=1348612 RepID=A0A397H9F2_9GLOM|nr:hypothetical protein Glove_374g28 [Diversispora epigaea]
MLHKDNFSYKNENINVIYINNNLRIYIEKQTSDIARIYFVNNRDCQIPIPANTILRNLTNNQIEPPLNNNFLITWISNYVIIQNGIEIFKLENQKQQVIKGAKDLETDLIKQ